MAENKMVKTAYHIEDGAKEMYTVDAESAVNRFPEEWAWEPWPGTEDKPTDKSQVVIPDDWKSFNAQKRRMLAIKLGAPNNVKVAEADQTIEDELTRRRRPKPPVTPAPAQQPQRFDPVTGRPIPAPDAPATGPEPFPPPEPPRKPVLP